MLLLMFAFIKLLAIFLLFFRDLIEFARNNDDLSKKIAYRGRDFIWNNLRMSDVTYFWKQLLKSYSKLVIYKPVLKKDLIKIRRE